MIALHKVAAPRLDRTAKAADEVAAYERIDSTHAKARRLIERGRFARNDDGGIAITVVATQDTVESDSFNNTYDENATYPVVNVTELKEALTNGGIDTGVNGGYGINVRNGATLTINGGYYYGGGTAVQVQKGTLIINGGTFACEPFGDLYGYNFLINCVDSAYKNGTAKVIINGGTFVNFDPSNCTAEGAGTNFVADGYKVVSEAHGTDTWYTVVKG